MKEMIKKIREDKGGFTLAELLIVVAIIAILVAIAIPVFTSSLAKANAATDAANIRAGYAEVAADALSSGATSGKYYLKTDGTVAKTGSSNDATDAYKCTSASTDLDSTSATIGGQTVNWSKTDLYITYSVSTDGKVTIEATSNKPKC